MDVDATLSDDNALLLDSDDHLYWQPNADTFGDISDVITARAWQFGGEASAPEGGDTGVDTSLSSDANGYFSTASDAVSVSVTGVNDAPLLSQTGHALTPVNENSVRTVLVSTLVSSLGYSDEEGASGGIAVTGQSGNGQWQYSTDEGNDWFSLDSAAVSASVLLDNNAQLRYAPDNKNAENVSLAVRAWDGSEGSASSGPSRQVLDTQTNGGQSAVSSEQATITLSVTDVNDAPTLNDANTYEMTKIDEDETSASVAVTSLLSDAGYDDVDDGASSGLALVSTQGNGSWEYSTDGNSWSTVGDVSIFQSLLLNSNTQLRYIGDGKSSEMASFEFHAWDTTNGAHGETYDIRGGGSVGAASAFSINKGTVTLQVDGANDAPVLDIDGHSPSLTAIPEDQAPPQLSLIHI